MRSSDAILWISAVLLYGAGDIATTLNNFSVGMVELNPLNVFAVKTVVFLAGGAIYTKTKEKIVPAVLCVLGVFAVVHNLVAYYF